MRLESPGRHFHKHEPPLASCWNLWSSLGGWWSEMQSLGRAVLVEAISLHQGRASLAVSSTRVKNMCGGPSDDVPRLGGERAIGSSLPGQPNSQSLLHLILLIAMITVAIWARAVSSSRL